MKHPRRWFGNLRWWRRSRRHGAVMWVALYPHSRFAARFEDGRLVFEAGDQSNFDVMVVE